MLKSDICLHYPAVASFSDKVMSLAGNDVPLIMNCERFTSLDYTSIKVSGNVCQINGNEMNNFFLLIINDITLFIV